MDMVVGLILFAGFLSLQVVGQKRKIRPFDRYRPFLSMATAAFLAFVLSQLALERAAPALGLQTGAEHGRLALPGFVDAHVHYPQIPVIGAMGMQLLEWLQRRTLPQQVVCQPVEGLVRAVAGIVIVPAEQCDA